MKKFAMGLVVLALAGAAFGQASRSAQLDSCNVRLGDATTRVRQLESDNRRLSEEAETCRRNREQAVNAANSERDRATTESQNLRNRNTELEARNRELTANVAQLEANAGVLQSLAAEKDRLATENMNLRNQLAAQPTVAIAAPQPERFRYPISGVLNNKRVENNVIIADLVFTNNGSRRITSFDSVLRFYFQGNKIYEIQLPNVRNPVGAAFGRNESINFRAGLPITDQNLVNAPVDSIDLLVEVTNIQ